MAVDGLNIVLAIIGFVCVFAAIDERVTKKQVANVIIAAIGVVLLMIDAGLILEWVEIH